MAFVQRENLQPAWVRGYGLAVHGGLGGAQTLVDQGPGEHDGARAGSEFYVAWWGVRGSIATPGERTARYGGNTSCVQVRVGERHFIIDCGTGIRALGRRLLAEGQRSATLLLSHYHWDHLQGLPFFAPLYEPGFELEIIAPRELGDPEKVLSQAMAPPWFPVRLSEVPARLRFVTFKTGDAWTNPSGLTLSTCHLLHPGGAAGYRFDFKGKSYAHLVDTEHPEGNEHWPTSLLRLVEGASVLCYDAMWAPEDYERHRGWGHSTFEHGAALAERARAGTLMLTHHDPNACDDALDALLARAQGRFARTLLAHEGLVIPLV